MRIRSMVSAMAAATVVLVAAVFTGSCSGGGSGGTPSTAPVTSSSPAVVISTSTLPDAIVGKGYSFTLQATGGNGSYTWSAVGTLPPGLSLSSAGVLIGIPGTLGVVGVAVSTSVTVRVTSGTATATQAFNLNVGWPPLVITTATLADGTVGVAYSQTLQATGGTAVAGGTYLWWVVTLQGLAPAPPAPGLTLSGTGVLSGTPTAAGTTTFTVGVQSGSFYVTQLLSATIR